MDDMMLRRQVENELADEPSIDAAGIGVAVHEGVVTLTGHVSSLADYYDAARAVLRVKGVRGLANELEVRLAAEHVRTDEDIAIAAANVLGSNAQIPPGQIQVTVQQGNVTLEGKIEWWYQSEIAAALVRSLIGVTGLTNNISVRRRPVNGSVKQQIETALRRTALSDPEAIAVESRGNLVVLRGTVDAWWEHDEAERVAWSVPGVTEVENDLKVGGHRHEAAA